MSATATRTYTPAEKRAFVKRLQAGRKAAARRRPTRLREVERQLAALGKEFRSLPDGHPRRIEIIHEVRPLGEERMRLRWGS